MTDAEIDRHLQESEKEAKFHRHNGEIAEQNRLMSQSALNNLTALMAILQYERHRRSVVGLTLPPGV
jgi:hypothetical protein